MTRFQTNATLESIHFEDSERKLHIHWQDGHKSQFAYIWLRHYKQFPVLGRPEQEDNNLPLEMEKSEALTIGHLNWTENEVQIEWSHDGSNTVHDLSMLRKASPNDIELSFKHPKPRHWLGSDAATFHWFSAKDLESADSRFEIFLQVRDFGIALIQGLPTDPESVRDICKPFGPIRNTHFGELFDIRSLPADNKGTGKNIGATAANAQAIHMDEGWRHGPPGLSFFHCLKAHPNGGASIFVDAIGAANSLRESHSQSFEFLTKTSLVWAAERNNQERFRTRGRVIALDNRGIVRGIRVSDRNIPPLDLPADKVEQGYQALGDFCSVLYQKQREFVHLFQPGEMAIFDNHRVLHARQSFDPSQGERWIQQLSVDREEFHNQFRQLAESISREEFQHWEPDAGLLSQGEYS
jgi:gamma-butyrobetaine dioxygenase